MTFRTVLAREARTGNEQADAALSETSDSPDAVVLVNLTRAKIKAFAQRDLGTFLAAFDKQPSNEAYKINGRLKQQQRDGEANRFPKSIKRQIILGDTLPTLHLAAHTASSCFTRSAAPPSHQSNPAIDALLEQISAVKSRQRPKPPRISDNRFRFRCLPHEGNWHE